SPKVFLRESWERAACLIERKNPRHYAHLLSSGDVDALVSMTRPHTDVIVVRADAGIRSAPPTVRDDSGAADICWLYGMYHDGYTIIVNGVHMRWIPIGDLCRGLESDMRHRVGANLYFTPAGSQGFLPHFDGHDVF